MKVLATICKACGEKFPWNGEDQLKHFLFKCNPEYKPEAPRMPFTMTDPVTKKLDEMQKFIDGYPQFPEARKDMHALIAVARAAHEICNILSDSDSRAEIDSFTAQPLEKALKELGE